MEIVTSALCLYVEFGQIHLAQCWILHFEACGDVEIVGSGVADYSHYFQSSGRIQFLIQLCGRPNWFNSNGHHEAKRMISLYSLVDFSKFSVNYCLVSYKTKFLFLSRQIALSSLGGGGVPLLNGIAQYNQPTSTSSFLLSHPPQYWFALLTIDQQWIFCTTYWYWSHTKYFLKASQHTQADQLFPPTHVTFAYTSTLV